MDAEINPQAFCYQVTAALLLLVMSKEIKGLLRVAQSHSGLKGHL